MLEILETHRSVPSLRVSVEWTARGKKKKDSKRTEPESSEKLTLLIVSSPFILMSQEAGAESEAPIFLWQSYKILFNTWL